MACPAPARAAARPVGAGRSPARAQRVLALLLLGAVVALDQATKAWAWRHVPGILAHSAGKGINDYLRSRQEQILEVPAPGEAVLEDLDTPEDYERLGRSGPLDRGVGESPAP